MGLERLRAVLEGDARVGYALLFGSRARGSAHAESDADVAIGVARGARLAPREVGELLSRLEAAAGGKVDLVLLDEAKPGLAYRIFRDGRILVDRDRAALVERKARAIIESLDFRPIEDAFNRAVLGATRGG